ncbi:MAG: hypothetical protein QW179_01420 [Candidatus Hadarchaeales archaeon]
MGVAERTTFRAIETLDKLGVKHAVSGMIAGAVYGHIRVTADVDIVVHVSEEEWENVIKEFVKGGFILRGEDFHKLGIATLKTSECFGVDLIREDDREVFERVKQIEYHGKKIPFVSLEDLIVFKLRFRRGKDIYDLRALLEINAAKIDWGYLERKVREPEERELLERLRRGEEIPEMLTRRAPPHEFCPGEK